jgi:hypothetical protein
MTRLVLRDNQLACKAGGDAIADMLKGNSVLTELDISKNIGFSECDPAEFAVALSPGIADNGAISVLNLAQNNLGELVLSGGWAEDYDRVTYATVYKHTDGRQQSDNPGKPEGIIAIANAIPDMRAMTSLNLASNRIGSEGAKHVAEAIKVSVLLWLFWYQFHAHLTNGSTAVVCHCPQDMGVMTSLTFGDRQVITMTAEMTEANFSGKLESHEAQMVAAFLPKCT